jgi:HD superfamily phosphohydrolase
VLVRDPVHGLISFEHDEASIVLRLLDTPEVQRLRRIRQLGLTNVAFIGAEHTRFAHALGAAHVMQLFIARLRKLHDALPFWQRLTSERARDAIAAAFLHDLGHGPLSHLFEEAVAGPLIAPKGRGAFDASREALDKGQGGAGATESGHAALHKAARQSAARGVTGVAGSTSARRHEEWTEQILLDPATAVHQVLVRDDPELPRRVAALVRGEHPLPYLARAVSGTFDVDRCDYLLRDAHETGVHYGRYDLPWLLHSLRFTEHSAEGSVAGDAAPGLAIDGTKGLSAIESFILARLFMFQQVYFHKSTRAAEWMIRAILGRAARLLADGARLPSTPRALHAIARGESPSLSEYLELDDQSLLEAINAWRSVQDRTLADLCQRLRGRALFKTWELFGEGASPARRREAHDRLCELARARGLDPDLYCALDVATDTPYSDDSSLWVIFGRGRPRRPAEVSFVLDRLRDETLTRVRLIFAPELKEELALALA